MTTKAFAAKLKSERNRLCITQQDLATLLSVSFEAISKWERGLSEPATITQEGALARLQAAEAKPGK